MKIRKAEIRDLDKLLAIYNYEVEHGTATFDLHPKIKQEWEKWFAAHNIKNYPLLIAEIEKEVAGYASLSAYREKEAYQATVELSVYVDALYRGRGVATELMKTILWEAKQDTRTHLVVSVITAGNEASRRLHEKFGFTFCGMIPEAGLKFGKYWGIENYSLKV